MSRFTPFIAFLVLLALGAVAGTWHSRQSRIASRASAEPPSTPLDAVGRPLDPEFIAAMKTEKGPKRWLRLVAASEQATAAEFPALIKMAEGDYTAIRIIAGRWAEVDPRHMFKSLHALLLQPKESFPDGMYSTRSALVESLFETWGRNDPAAVLKALKEVPDFNGLADLRRSAVYELAKSNPPATLEAMALWNINDYPETKKLQEWAAKDPAAAALAVLKLGNQNVRSEVLQVIGKAWAAIDPQAALAHAETLSGNARLTLAREAIAAWAKRDPQAAASFASSQENAAYRAALGGMVALSMGESDPAAAVAWSQANLHGRSRNEAVASVVATAAEKDPTGAAELVSAMEQGPMKSSAGDALFRAWFAQPSQRQAAMQWLSSEPDEELRRNAFSRVEWSWYREDPAGAGDFLTGPNGHLASLNMVSNVARYWALSSPDAALARTAKLPEPQAIAARSTIVSAWMNTRPEAAMAYFNQLPPGPERNSVISNVAQTVPYQNPERAATFLRGLQADEQKVALQQIASEQRVKVEAALKKP